MTTLPTRNDRQNLKARIVEELTSWAGELSDIAGQIQSTPTSVDTTEESESYDRASRRVDRLVEEVGRAAVAGVAGEAAMEIYTENRDDAAAPAFRFEANARPPWATYASGGLVGYSDVSAADAATQLKLLLCDLGLSVKNETVYAPTGEILGDAASA